MTRSNRYLLFIAGSLTLGLAPFSPMPHLFEKLAMLFSGTLHRPVDIFDLALHGLFPALLLIEVLRHPRSKIRS